MERTYPLPNGELITVRPPKPADAESCLAYLRLVGGETDYLYLDQNGLPDLTVEAEARYLTGLNENPKIAAYFGFVGTRLVAMCNLEPDDGRARLSHNGTLALSVVRDYWHMGIGTLFMGLIVDAGKALGYRTLHLAVSADNARAIALYERFGFEKIGLHRDYLYINGRYVDQILMDLRI